MSSPAPAPTPPPPPAPTPTPTPTPAPTPPPTTPPGAVILEVDSPMEASPPDSPMEASPPDAPPDSPTEASPPDSQSNSTLSPPRTQSDSGSGSGISTGVVVGIAIGGVAVLIVLSLLFIWCKKKRRRHYGPTDYYGPPPVGPKGSDNPLPPPSPGHSLGFSKSTFTYEELAMATDGFSEANLLGQGGFGYVHRGMLPNGKEVAVKQLKAGSGQGEREFQAEVEIISRVHHKHLVSLVGYCITGIQRMLVYEFVPNNTLEFHLHELITGRRPVDSSHTNIDDCLVDWARPLLTRALEDGNYDSLVDPRLQKEYNPNEMACMAACAASCVRHSARHRPRMSQIVRALEGDVSLSDLNEGIRPGRSTLYSSYGSSDYDTMQYNEDMKKFRKTALASQEYGSSEYSNPTSDYPSGSSGEAQQTTREMEMAKKKKDSQGSKGPSSNF